MQFMSHLFDIILYCCMIYFLLYNIIVLFIHLIPYCCMIYFTSYQRVLYIISFLLESDEFLTHDKFEMFVGELTLDLYLSVALRLL